MDIERKDEEEVENIYFTNLENCFNYSNEKLYDLLYINNILGKEELIEDENIIKICKILARIVDFEPTEFRIRDKQILPVFPKRIPPPLPKSHIPKGWNNVPLSISKYQPQTKFRYEKLPLDVSYEINKYLDLADMKSLALINKQNSRNYYKYIKEEVEAVKEDVKNFINTFIFYSYDPSEKQIIEKALESEPKYSIMFMIELYKETSVQYRNKIDFYDLFEYERVDVIRYLLSYDIPGLKSIDSIELKNILLLAQRDNYLDIIHLVKTHPNYK